LVPLLVSAVSLTVTQMYPLPQSKVARSAEITNGFWKPEVKELDHRYVNPNTCFLSVTNKTIWTFLGPVILVTLLNTLLIGKVATIIYKSSNNKISNSRSGGGNVSKSLRQSVKGSMMLMPILSVPWIIGLLYDLYEEPKVYSTESEVKMIFGITGAYLQVIFAGVQGILIFFLYCIQNNEVKSAHVLAMRQRQHRQSIAPLMSSSYSSTRKFSSLFTFGSSSRSESHHSNKSILQKQKMAENYEMGQKGSAVNVNVPLTSFGKNAKKQYTA